MKLAILSIAAVALCACTGVPFERTYSVEYEDSSGGRIGASVTLKPTDSKRIKPIKRPKATPTPKPEPSTPLETALT